MPGQPKIHLVRDVELAEVQEDETVPVQTLIVLIGVATVVYNGVLAALFARGFPMGQAVPSLTEVCILGLSGIVILKSGLTKSSLFPIGLAYGIMVISILLSLRREAIYLVSLRNFLIIACFTLLGQVTNFKSLKTIFLIASVVTLAVLALEVSSLSSYVSVFQPGKYLSGTRGISESEYSGGLATGTILFNGRFSLGLYSGPRTSSIFLEQVSINCFAIVLAMYLMVFAKRLTRRDFFLHAFTIFAILATNNARMALIASLMFLAGYPIFPRLPKYLHMLVMPACLGGMLLLFNFVDPRSGDDLIGRMTTTYALVKSMTVADIAAGNLDALSMSLDSGYAYVIFGVTGFGLILYWLYISLIVPQSGATSKRCAWGLSLYISIWLLVGGTGSFSMKTAPLLWLMVGLVRRETLDKIHSTISARSQRAALTRASRIAGKQILG